MRSCDHDIPKDDPCYICALDASDVYEKITRKLEVSSCAICGNKTPKVDFVYFRQRPLTIFLFTHETCELALDYSLRSSFGNYTGSYDN